MKIAAQVVGLVGIICSLLSFQQKERKHVMLFQMTASALFCIQLFMVGAITGGCVDSISFVRTVVFSQNDKKWAASPVWLGVFIAAMIATGYPDVAGRMEYTADNRLGTFDRCPVDEKVRAYPYYIAVRRSLLAGLQPYSRCLHRGFERGFGYDFHRDRYGTSRYQAKAGAES